MLSLILLFAMHFAKLNVGDIPCVKKKFSNCCAVYFVNWIYAAEHQCKIYIMIKCSRFPIDENIYFKKNSGWKKEKFISN